MPNLARRLRLPLLVLALLFASACIVSTAPHEEELVLEVASTRASCVGAAPMQCLQVRTSADAPWQLFYDAIEGFTWEPGYRYTLRVARRAVLDPPADGSSVAFRLLEILAKVAE
jgi:hypothetical protein